MERFFGLVPNRGLAGNQRSNPEATAGKKPDFTKAPLPWDEPRKKAKELHDESKRLADAGDKTGAAAALYSAGLANEEAFDLVTDPKLALAKALMGLDAAFDYFNSAHYAEAHKISRSAQGHINTVDHHDTYQMLSQIELSSAKHLPPPAQ